MVARAEFEMAVAEPAEPVAAVLMAEQDAGARRTSGNDNGEFDDFRPVARKDKSDQCKALMSATMIATADSAPTAIATLTAFCAVR